MKTAVVLAGGRGRRLLPLTADTPKAMVPVGGRPIMEFVVGGLRSSGFERILVLLQHRPGPIVEHFGDGSRFGLAMDYLLQEGDLGTAGSVRQALDLIEDDDFLVSSSDILFHGDLLPGAELHLARENLATLALARVDDLSGFGAAVRGPGDRIVEFREKPSGEAGKGALASAGLYFLNRRAMQEVEQGRAVDFGRDLFPALVRRGAPIEGWDLPGYWRDVGTPFALEAARRDVAQVPALNCLVTRFPAGAGGRGGNIWVHVATPAGEWLLMSIKKIGNAAGLVWKLLSENREAAIALSRIEHLDGVSPEEALAAVEWLAREGKVQREEAGRATRVRLSASELGALSS